MAHIPCDSCVPQKTKTQANVACFQCRKFYCDICRLQHRNDQSKSKHTLVSLGELVSEVEGSSDFDFSSDFLGLILQNNKLQEHFEQVAITTDLDASDKNPNGKKKIESVSGHFEQVVVTSSDAQDANLLQTKSESTEKNAQVVISEAGGLESAKKSSEPSVSRNVSRKFSEIPSSRRSFDSEPSRKNSEPALGSKDTEKLKDKYIGLKPKIPYELNNEIETNCRNIRGVASLSDGRIVAYNGQKKKLLMYDISGNLITAVPVPGCWSLTVTEKDEIALTCFEDESIIFYGVKETKIEKLSKTFKVNKECYGIACCANRLAVTCDIHDESASSLLIFNSEGREMKKITSVKGLMRPPFHEHVSITEGYIYVSDYDHKRVVCLKHDGSLVKFISTSWKPTGVSIETNHVILGDYDSRQIKLLKRADYSVKTFIEDLPGSPTYLYYDSRLGRVIVCLEGGDKVYIYCPHQV